MESRAKYPELELRELSGPQRNTIVEPWENADFFGQSHSTQLRLREEVLF